MLIKYDDLILTGDKTLRIKINIDLLDDEVARIEEIRTKGIRFSTSRWFPRIALKSIPRKYLKLSFEVLPSNKPPDEPPADGINKTDGSELNEVKFVRKTLLSSGRNVIVVNIRNDKDSSSLSFNSLCNGIIKLELLFNTGAKIPIELLIRQNEEELSGRFKPRFVPAFKTFATVIGLAAVALFLLELASNNKDVYNRIDLNLALISALSTAIFTYFAFPRITDIASGVRLTYFKKLLSYAKHPEFYFDPIIVRLLRSWITLALITLSAIASFSTIRAFTVYEIDDSSFDKRFSLISIQKDTNKDDGYLWHNINDTLGEGAAFDQRIVNMISEAFPRIQEYAPRRVGRLYRGDLRSVCVIHALHPFSSDEDSREGRPCIALPRRLHGNRFELKWLDFKTPQDRTFNFKDVDSFDNDGSFPNFDLEHKAALVLSNSNTRKKVKVYLDNGAVEINVISPDVDISPYFESLAANFNRVKSARNKFSKQLHLSSVIPGIRNVSQEDYQKSLSEIKEIINRKVIDHAIDNFDDRIILPQAIEIASEGFANQIQGAKLKPASDHGGIYRQCDQEKTLPISSDNVPEMLLIAKNRENDNDLRWSITYFWAILENYFEQVDRHEIRLALRNTWENSALKINKFVEKHHSSYSTCDRYKITKDVDEVCNQNTPTLCHALRNDVIVNLIFALLSLEKKLVDIENDIGDAHIRIHSIIVDNLIKEYNRDLVGYLLITHALDRFTDERAKFFENKTDAGANDYVETKYFRCYYSYVAAEHAYLDVPPNYNKGC